MNFKAYINYLQNGGIHAGVYMNDEVLYVRDAPSGTHQSLNGYLEIRLNEGVPRTLESVRSVIHEAYASFGRPANNSFHHIDARSGHFEISYRDSLPATPEDAVAEFQKYFERIITEHERKVPPRG